MQWESVARQAKAGMKRERTPWRVGRQEWARANEHASSKPVTP